jgi:hypothetical protein
VAAGLPFLSENELEKCEFIRILFVSENGNPRFYVNFRIMVTAEQGYKQYIGELIGTDMPIGGNAYLAESVNKREKVGRCNVTAVPKCDP